MTDFHKLFMVNINKMIEKKTGASLLVIYVIYGRLVYTDSKKTVLFTFPTAGFLPLMQLLKCNYNAYRVVYVCSIMSLTIRIDLYLSVLSNFITSLMYNIKK